MAALPDLESVVARDPDYDFHRAAALLAQAYALTGEKEKAEELFRRVTIVSTLSGRTWDFADLLASEGRDAEARQWARQRWTKNPPCPAICAAGAALVAAGTEDLEASAGVKENCEL